MLQPANVCHILMQNSMLIKAWVTAREAKIFKLKISYL